MKTVVISLASALDRRREVQRQLDDSDQAFEFFDALPGDAGRACFAAVSEAEFMLSTGRPGTKGEIGCYASHLSVWQRCVAADEPMLIMEDDFRLLPNFTASVAAGEHFIHHAGFIRLQDFVTKRRRLQATERPGAIPVAEHGGLTLAFLQYPPLCLMAYVIHPRAAAAFIACSKTARMPVDRLMQRTGEHGIPIYALLPSSVTDNELSTDSTIDYPDRNKDKDIGLSVRRALYRTRHERRRRRFNKQMLAQIAAGEFGSSTR